MATIDPSIKVVKSMPWRGGSRFFLNRYYFDNLKPADNTKWTTFCDAVVAAEKLTMQADTDSKIVQVYGYDAGSDVPVFSKAYTQIGTGAFTGYQSAPGDCAALVRYSTSARTIKNHPIYLFNYYHHIGIQTGGYSDILNTAQRTAFNTYATAWVTGFSDGAVTHHRCGPQGHTATGVLVDANIRHRDFPAG